VKAFWVNSRLAFGSAIGSWRHVRQLHAMGVTHVINLRSSRRYRTKLRSFHSVWLPFPDDKRPRPASFYRDAFGFFKRAIQEDNSKVYVMCHHGICRSASLTYFFLRLSQEGSKQAEALVLKARPTAIIVPAYRESCEAFLLRARR
jgi:protein-tyrosine phosphatase